VYLLKEAYPHFIFGFEKRLLQNIDSDSFAKLSSCCIEESADGLDYASLLTNGFTEIARIDVQLKNNCLFTLARPDLNPFGLIHKRSCNPL